MIGSTCQRAPQVSTPTDTSTSVVVLAAQVRDRLLTFHLPDRVLQPHQLDEQIVVRELDRHGK